jgi:peroxiredoxin
LADRVLASRDFGSNVLLLADVVKVMALVGRGEYEQSVASVASALGALAADRGSAVPALSVGDKVSLLDAYFQRLVQANQFVVAIKAFTLVRDGSSDPEIKAFATSRLTRLEQVGKPAPAISGTDLDGRPVSLADLRGNSVLVVFWASWCVNNAEEVARLEAVYEAYRGRGFRVVGISLDSLDEREKSAGGVRAAVRHFVMDHNIRWPNLISGTGAQDYSRAFAVTEVPANVLIGRDGTIIGLDLTGANLDKSVAMAVGR